jgi:hypothetical protein
MKNTNNEVEMSAIAFVVVLILLFILGIFMSMKL